MAKLFKEMLSSEEFKKLILGARDAYKDTHIETGFTGAKKFMNGEYVIWDRPFIFSDVSLGAGTSANVDENSISLPTLGHGKADGLIDVIKLHYHGKLDSFCPPSAQDLLYGSSVKQMSLEYDGIKINPIVAVAHYDQNGKSQILAFQEKNFKILNADSLEIIAENYENESYHDARNVTTDREGYKSLKQSAEFLKKLGIYNVAIFSCDETGVPKNIERKIKNFSSEHEIVPEIFNLSHNSRNEKIKEIFKDLPYYYGEDDGYMQCPKNY
jgi:hypothetical protein